MSYRNCTAIAGLLAAIALVAPGRLDAATVKTVNSADNIYGAGLTRAPGDGNVPTAIIKLPATAVCVGIGAVMGSQTCVSHLGCITLNGGTGTNLNDPDGRGAAVATSSNTGTAVLSGITAPYAGFLTGVFTERGKPKGTAPPALDFTTGAGTHFTTLSPLLDQTFFIGGGRTGNGNGRHQFFFVPSSARRLYLGISDACGYHGAPGCYDDNVGSYQVAVSVHKGTCPAEP